MRKWALIAILLGIVLPANAAQRVSVEQLERILAEAQNTPDNELAAKLSDLRLTERLTSARLARWKASLAGQKSQRALLGLADQSAFLEPPSSDIPQPSQPDMAEQRRIMGLAANYVSKAIPQLPRIFATRTTVHFEDSPKASADAASADSGDLHAIRISRANVLYREGEEVVEAGPVKVEKSNTPEQGLKTWGAFGPILALVLLDAAQNKLAWSHWEQGTNGPAAVFSYAVPTDKSHYEVRYCCTLSAYGLETDPFQQMSAYHGEMAIDPATGIIQRLTLEADLDSSAPISRAAIAVEYAPVEMGGMTYICPANSISISVARTLRSAQDGTALPIMGPPQMLLNHMVFEQYHLFRSESRVLSADEERAAGVAPDATLPSTNPPDALPADEVLADAPARPSPTAAEIAAATPPDPNAEITTSVAKSLPETPAHPQPAPTDAAANLEARRQANGFTLRVSSHLVDVNVVALDKKGHPITGLKPEDFEIYDNGVKQDVHSFSQADVVASTDATAPATPPVASALTFTNHPARNARPEAEGNTVVLLIDASNLAYPDLVDARQQMLQFLKAAPTNERVALYVSRYHGFQVLEEPTVDHAKLASRLSGWKPDPQDVGNANDEEQRNRQHIETVHAPEDLLSVNGNFTLDTFTQSEALDPKLRELGSNPGPNALSLLVDVGHHLAVLPGHKSLVWVTSDNALADWNKLSITIEKGSKYIEPFALRTQEALNNAHVSIYPLDASRLEGAVVDSGIGARNVELTPTFQRADNPRLQALETQIEGPEFTAGQDVNPYNRNRDFGGGGRLSAQMQQDLHPIQGVFREVAEATGGRAFRRSNNMIGELNGVVIDGHATYVLGFSPSMEADGKYHVLAVKLASRRDVTLRYRTGYKYDKEPTTLKERFSQAVWQPVDAGEISVSTKPITDAAGRALRITVAGADLDLAEQSALYTGKLDIFLVKRDEEGLHAKVSGKTVGLRLKPATYQKALNEGLTFDERIESKVDAGSLRVVVVDVNSGRIGSVTVPSTALEGRP
jgi:VWFA-related protein